MKGCQIVRCLNTGAPALSTAAAGAFADSVPAAEAASVQQIVTRTRRRVIPEVNRSRANIASRRFDSAQERLKLLNRERQLLVDRHRDAIESNDLTDLYSIVEAVEFTQDASNSMLNNVLMQTKQHDRLKSLNDRQLSILVLAGGKLALNVPIHRRVEYLNELWKNFEAANVELGIQSYNARISAFIDNRVEQNVVNVLQELSSKKVDANGDTFALLAKVYALQGNTTGIMNIIEVLKEQNIPATQPLFESVVYSLVYNGEDKQMRTVIQSLSSNPSLDPAGLYLAGAMAKAAQTNDVEEVLKVLAEAPHTVTFNKKPLLAPMIELAINILSSNATGVIQKLRPYMFLYNDALPNFYNIDHVYRQLKQFFKNGKETATFELLTLLPPQQKKEAKIFLLEQLHSFSQTTPDKVLPLAELFRQQQIHDTPLISVIDHLRNNRFSILPMYNQFLESDEYQSVADRKHIVVPRIVSLMKQIHALPKTDSSRVPLLNTLFNTVNAAVGCVTGSLLGDFQKLCQEIAEDEVFLREVIEHTSKTPAAATYFVSAHLHGDLKKLQSLLDGPLADEKLLIIPLHASIMRLLKQDSLSPLQLRTVTRVISAGFGGYNKTQPFEFRFLKNLFESYVISDQRLHDIVRLLSDDAKVTLSAEEIKLIGDGLNEKKKVGREKLLKQLQRKSKTVLRWMNSKVEDLEQEIVNLKQKEDVNPSVFARLYGIILSKHAANADINNGRSMLEAIKSFNELKQDDNGQSVHRFIAIALQRAIVHGDAETADELWSMKSDFSNDSCLSYALSLVERKQMDKAAEVLAQVKRTPDDVLFIRTIQQSRFTPNVMEEFISLLTRKFAISNLTQRRLNMAVKKIELQSAVDCGDLERAFDVAKVTSERVGFAFGQNDLMAACIRAENLSMLQKVFKMVVKHHGANPAFVDMMVAFLECDEFQKAEQIVKKAADLSLGTAKMEFLNVRETKLRKPEVLHNLFLLMHDRASSADTMESLKHCVNLYTNSWNVAGLEQLQADISRINFPVDQQFKAHLKTCIERVTNAQTKQGASNRPRPSNSHEQVKVPLSSAV